MESVKVNGSSLGKRAIRLIKFLRYKFTQETIEVGPFGIDSAPLKNQIGIYAETSKNGRPVIIGYINENQKAGTGEIRLFSKDSNGEEQTFLWLKNDGTIQIAGNTDNAVRYSPLNAGLQSLKNEINVELTKIQVAITGLGGAYTKVDTSVDISGSKIDEVKTS